MFRINPFKPSREEKYVPNKVRASVRTNPITVSQPLVITKKVVNFDSNGLSSSGVDNTAKTRRPQLRSNTKNDRIPSASKSSCSKNKEVEVEEHLRNLLLSKNKKHMSSECNNVKLATKNVKSIVVCAMCKQCLMSANHDVCLLNYVNDMNSRGYPNLFMVRQLGLFQAYDRESTASHNFRLEVFGTVRFGNDHVAVILGFGDLQWGNILIATVYFVEGLGHILFSVGQFCDLDLESLQPKDKKIIETMNVKFDELLTMAFEQSSSKPRLQSMTSGQISSGLDLNYAPSTITTQQPTEGELDLLFEAMYDDYIGDQLSAAPRTVLAAQAPQVLQTPTTSTTIADTAPTPTNSSSQATNIPNTSLDVDGLKTQQQHAQQQGNQALLQTKTIAANVLNAMFDDNTFVNPFATPSTMSTMEPKNVQEAMTNPVWIELMQEELLQFKRLDSNYVLEILKEYGMESCDPVGTSMKIKDKLDLDQNGTPVDATKYRSIIGALMYLTSSRPDIVHATCLCARFELTGFLDADYAGCKDTFKSTSGGAQLLGEKLLTDYGFYFNKILIYCDSKSAIAISCNPVQHSRTKHIVVRYHFIKELVEKGTIELYFVKTDYQLADLFTKALPVDRFNYSVRRLSMRNLSPQELDRLAKSQ
nr:hypothetical protein [Tanacetum cinerariifolium]